MGELSLFRIEPSSLLFVNTMRDFKVIVKRENLIDSKVIAKI